MPRIAVIGAGAAGTMAAIFAARGGAETILLERTDDGGRKILISGGGRCNILPARLDESRFVTDSSRHTLKNIVRSWPLSEQIAFLEHELKQPLVEEVESGKLFPKSDKARDVRDGLLDVARRAGVAFRPNALAQGAEPHGTMWRVLLKESEPLEVDAVIVATGGLSVPKTGSEGTGLAIAKTLGHTVHETYPALTPITATPAPFAHLAGVSLSVVLSASGAGRAASATGGFLFTHRGYSGPSVLDVSHVAVRSGGQARLEVRWSALDESAWDAALSARSTRGVLTIVREHVPERLAEALIRDAGVEPALQAAQLKRADRLALVAALCRFALPWHGDEGYKKAEVTGGGVSLAEVNPRTMESRKQAGLFLCGEMLDAFGPIGGYNFLWAWVTGRAAGVGAAAHGAVKP